MKRGAHYLRKRVIAKNPSASTRLLDKIVLIIAFLAPLVEIPQLLEIYVNKAAQNVSMLTWGLFVVFGIPWLLYGIAHKEKPIIILYALWIIIDSAIVIGIIMYG